MPSAWLIHGISAFAACRSPPAAAEQSSFTALSMLSASATRASATTALVPSFCGVAVGCLEIVLLAGEREAGAAQVAFLSCRYGIDGWLLWTWDTEEHQAELWHGSSAGGLIAEALSPRARPDPCQPPP
jgi:hypothetical protein